MAWPVMSTRSICGFTARTDSMTSGVSVRLTRVARRSPGLSHAAAGVPGRDLAHPADKHAAGAGDGVLHLAALGHDGADGGDDLLRVALRHVLDLLEGRGVDVEALDVDEQLAFAQRQRRIDLLRPLGEHALLADDTTQAVEIHGRALTTGLPWPPATKKAPR